MASTRNKNTPGNYNLEDKAYIDRYSMIMDMSKRTPNQKTLAGNGLLHGKVASRDLATNYTDIESTLFGIGSTNLVKPLPQVIPEIHSYPSLNIIQKIPMIIPSPVYIDTKQRANYLN